MNFKIVKLDRRYAYNEYFKYMVRFEKSNPNQKYFYAMGRAQYNYQHEHDIIKVLEWFNSNYGLSHPIEVQKVIYEFERSLLVGSVDYSVNRCWSLSADPANKHYRIFIENKEILAHFRLTFD